MGVPKINVDDCLPEIREQLLAAAGVTETRKPRTNTFPIDRVRNESIKVLAVIATLTPGQRECVLKHALKMNEV